MISDEYIAGFFDGEGSIYTNRNSYISLQVAQRKPEVLEMIQDAWWGYGQIKCPNDCFFLRVDGNKQCREILPRLIPFLVVKKEPAILALDLLCRCAVRWPSHGGRLPQEEMDVRLDIMRQIKQFNVGYRHDS